MDCRHVTEQLARGLDQARQDEALATHVRSCASCAALAQGEARVDAALRANLVVAPPSELSQRLAALARASGREVRAGRSQEDRGASIAQPRRMSRPARFEERLAAYVLAALAAMALGNTVGLGQWASLFVLAQEVVVAVQVLLTSPVLWLLPDLSDTLAWLAPGLAMLPLFWLLRPGGMRRENTSRAGMGRG